MRRSGIALIVCALAIAACDQAQPTSRAQHENGGSAAGTDVEAATVEAPGAGVGSAEAGRIAVAPAANGTHGGAVSDASSSRAANELGRIPILEYHLIGDEEGRWQRSYEGFRQDLELLYARGYRPITIAELVDRAIDLPAGLSPVVVTFDDASPGQFRYIERAGVLEIDPSSAAGIWLEFHKRHPDWSNKAVFCMLPGAEEGRSFFGDKGIEGQKSEWRLRKVKLLADLGFELCNHTLWHARLDRFTDAQVQEQIARGALAIDSAAAGYVVRTFALPLGRWPANRDLARAGSWTDPRTGRVIRYRNDAILLVAGGPARSPHDPEFDPLRLPRVQVFEDELSAVLDQLDKSGRRYVSDGDPRRVARPNPVPAVTTR